MVILIVYLTLKGLVLLFSLFIYVTLLFRWEYLTSSFDHYVEQNLSLRDLLQNSCSKSELNKPIKTCLW